MKLSGSVSLSVVFFALTVSTALAQSSIITTYSGPALPVNGSSALTQTIGVPQAVTADGSGGFYIASNQNRVYHVTAEGTLTAVAGTGIIGSSGDNGPASSAQFNYLQGIVADSAGNVFISDSKNNRVRKVGPTGVITTVAGNGSAGWSGDGGPAVSAHFSGPRGLAVDRAGDLFIADAGNNVVRMVTPAGVIKTVAGNGTQGLSGDGGAATSASLSQPVAVAIDPSGNLFIADRHNDRIRKVNTAGVISTFASSSAPVGVAADHLGNVFIADTGNNRIRMVTPAGVVTTVAGTGNGGFSGDGGPAVSAQLALPVDVSVDAAGNLFVADQANYRIRLVNPAGVISTVAGVSDDGHSAMSAQFFFPNSIAVDQNGNVYVADTDIHRIRKITPDGTLITVAGNGTPGYSGDGGAATSAQLYYPAGITVDSAGNLYIADTRNQRVRKVGPNGVITTVAGNGGGNGDGDGGPALQAQLIEPGSVAVDGSGNVYIAETGGHRIRQVNTAGVITTVAGNRTMGFSGDGGPAASAQLAFPAGVAVDSAGNVFIADSANNRIRIVTPNGLIRTFAGDGTSGFAGDGGDAPSAKIAYPQSIVVDAVGNVFIADTNNQRIRKVTASGLITSVAGNGVYGFSGDGGAPLAAEITSPYGVAVDALNRVFISDTFSNRIRQVVSSGIPFAISDHGGALWTTAGNSSTTKTGYARIEAASGSVTPAGLAIFSYRPADVLISETAVPATAPLTSGRLYADIDGPVNTGIAIANPNPQPATINFYFTDAAGNDVGSGTATIGPNQQMARFLNGEPFNTISAGSFQGTFSFTSDVPVGAIAIRGLVNERGEFLMSTLPVIDLAAKPPTGTVAVPHFVHGGGWTTQILLVNPGNSTLAGTVEFRAEDGSLATVVINGESKSSFAYAVPPHSSQKLVPDGSAAAPTTGSVRIMPSDGGVAPVPLVNFSYQSGGVVVTQAGVPSSTGTAFRVYVESSGVIQSAIAVANDNPSPVTVKLEITNLDGTSTGLPQPVSMVLPGFGHIAKFISDALQGMPSSFKGILRVSTDSAGVSVIGLRTAYNERSELLITTTPPTSESAPSASGQLLMPHLPDGGGFTSQIILYSAAGGQSPSGSIVLVDESGQPFNVAVK